MAETSMRLNIHFGSIGEIIYISYIPNLFSYEYTSINTDLTP